MLTRRRLLGVGGALAAGLALGPGVARAQPLRVATLFQGATDSAVALGLRPCGVVESWSERPVYRYLRPALAEVPSLGLETQPSLEDLALLAPELIVASRFRHARIAPLLERLCPLVMLEEVFEFKRTLAALGAAVDRTATATGLLRDWQTRIATLRVALQRHYGAQWPPTVAVLDVRGDHLRSYLPASFAGQVLSELGFAWPAASQGSTASSLKLTSRESLPVLEADVFFVFLRADQAAQRHYARLLEHPLWQRLSAPQRGQVWRVDGVAWTLGGGILAANLLLDDIARILAG
ncbi:ABC transporter substrate-binding protein [Pseudomonas oryzihabitans]|uniref:Iron complex transport system substrate-binding protein n=1 Tax=Pseudomonas oryzihabitans TaxID=47885 RepID=A0AAJ2BSQ0_9PSED|nr:iron complex transport system substrate-binding protein [Pseudomonas psychrotolerans]MDR6353634.1 iron complex transport system substrate-binding protein [Pseudomonas psychrotolerans]